MYQIRIKNRKKNELAFFVDVFPGYDSKTMGPNPYVMFRESFGMQSIATLLPPYYQVKVPEIAPAIHKNKHAIIEHDTQQQVSS